MTADQRFRSIWDEGEMVSYPRDQWISNGMPTGSLPPGDEVPTDVAVVYTADMSGHIRLGGAPLD